MFRRMAQWVKFGPEALFYLVWIGVEDVGSMTTEEMESALVTEQYR